MPSLSLSLILVFPSAEMDMDGRGFASSALLHVMMMMPEHTHPSFGGTETTSNTGWWGMDWPDGSEEKHHLAVCLSSCRLLAQLLSPHFSTGWAARTHYRER
jgi:hypothetical protein